MKVSKGLVEASSQAVANLFIEQTTADDLAPMMAAHLLMYWDGSEAAQLSGELNGLHAEKAAWCAENGRLEDLWLPFDPEGFETSLGVVDCDEDPACRALQAWSNEHEGDRSVEAHYLEVARLLGAHWGIPVVTEGYDWFPPLLPQVLANMDKRTAAEWKEKGWLPAPGSQGD